MIQNMNDAAVLNNGVKMPWLGFGVYQMRDGAEVEESVGAAIETGYRSIDTAAAYNNERGVGRALAESGISRNDIFLTTKVWNSNQGYDSALRAFDESLERLGTDYVDLYLIHWPVKGRFVQTWRALERIYAEKRARTIGVSNFHIHHLEELLGESEIVPAVNQVEFHPFLLQSDLRAFCRERSIQYEAWSPLMQGTALRDKTVRKIAKKYGKSAAQIIIRWDIQHEVVTIPKSVHSERIEENSRVFDFEISNEDMVRLDGLDAGKRIGPDPDNFNF